MVEVGLFPEELTISFRSGGFDEHISVTTGTLIQNTHLVMLNQAFDFEWASTLNREGQKYWGESEGRCCGIRTKIQCMR